MIDFDVVAGPNLSEGKAAKKRRPARKPARSPDVIGDRCSPRPRHRRHVRMGRIEAVKQR